LGVPVQVPQSALGCAPNTPDQAGSLRSPTEEGDCQAGIACQDDLDTLVPCG
jgi:hypothetical protein